jgi:hypothetical protein
MSEPVKTFLDVIPTAEEVGAMKLTLIKKAVAKAGMDNRTFQDGVDQAIMSAYFQAAMNNYAEAQHVENEWWKMMSDKYKLVDGTFLDFDVGRFYTVAKQTEDTTKSMTVN